MRLSGKVKHLTETGMRLTKSEALEHWRTLDGQGHQLRPTPIPYKHRGSTYGADGLRIEGSRDFIDCVLARVRDLMQCENSETRLALNYQQVEPREGKSTTYAGQWVCYVKVHERGSEAQMANAFVGGLRK